MRLFVALELPDSVRAELARWRLPVLQRYSELRAVRDEALHVTLCFLGAQPVAAVPEIAAACRAACAGAGPASLALGPALWLPRRRPRVLAVQLMDGAGALGAIQARLAGRLAGGGWYHPEQRAFLPHVTVARVRSGGRVRAAALEAAAPLEFAGDAVTLYRSQLGAGGSRYSPLAQVRLGTG